MAAFVFMDVNGVDLSARPDEFERTVLAVAAGSLSKGDLIEGMRARTKARE